jgi:putative ABC transport system ATP-binding protein
MNLLGCLDSPTSGEYWLNGRQVSRLDDDELAHVRNREIGFVFQTFNLLPRATALTTSSCLWCTAGELHGTLSAARAGAVDRGPRSPQAERAVRRAAPARRHRARLVTDPPSSSPTSLLGTSTQRSGDQTAFDRLHAAGNTIILVTHEADIAGHAHREVFLLDGRVERDQVRAARATASSPGTSAL